MAMYNGKKVLSVVRTEPTYGEVDSELSTTSENPVQNKVVTTELNKKAYTNDIENGLTVAGKSLSTKAIENVSEESGTIQENPFIAQGTGTNNNTESVDTSPVGKQLEKQGNSIVYNQLVNSNTTEITLANGRKYLTIISGVYSIINGLGQTINVSQTDKIVDLTKWFNGDIPQDLLDNPETFSWYYNGDLTYNTGEIRDCNGEYLVCGGRNVWDEVLTISSNTLSSTNYIRVIPNKPYYLYAPKDAVVSYYDKDKTLISSETATHNDTFTTPNNCTYIKFEIASYGTTYNNDITISLYYSTGDGYDEYYPYEEPNVYETGTEVLRKAGTAKDIKLPSGTIERHIGSVDLGSASFLSWGKYSFEYGGITHYYFSTSNSPFKGTISGRVDFVANGLCAKYQIANYATVRWGTYPAYTTNRGELDCIAFYTGLISVYDKSLDNASSTVSDFKASNVGVIVYGELATPITEQGTPFSENIQIDDYGTMAFKDADEEYVEIPQGVKIFYPADYVLFIDSLVKETNGAVENLALKTDLLPKLPSSSADGTYVLKAVKSGDTITYSWGAEAEEE